MGACIKNSDAQTEPLTARTRPRRLLSGLGGAVLTERGERRECRHWRQSAVARQSAEGSPWSRAADALATERMGHSQGWCFAAKHQLHPEAPSFSWLLQVSQTGTNCRRTRRAPSFQPVGRWPQRWAASAQRAVQARTDGRCVLLLDAAQPLLSIGGLAPHLETKHNFPENTRHLRSRRMHCGEWIL